MEELEKLDETRLAAVAGMYALKRRQKQFHDHHIIPRHFEVGDLVLVFTLKQLASKFTKRGRGPYVISKLSPNGAVKLETLEGEEMPNWLSGCRIKKYHEPLTNQQLKTLHKAKWRKETKELTIKLAQEESKQRALKLKQRKEQMQTRVFKLQTTSPEKERLNDLPKPIINVQIGEDRLLVKAFLDTGADSNLMSYDFYQKLDKVALNATSTTIQTFTGQTVTPKGVCEVEMFVNELTCGDEFLVTQSGLQDTPLILGRAWQIRHNCFFNWAKRLVHCQSGINEQWLTLQSSNLRKQAQEQPCQTSHPATQTSNEDQEQTKLAKPQQKEVQNIQKWIPKKLHQAQSATTAIWLPKGNKLHSTQYQKTNASIPKDYKKSVVRKQSLGPSNVKYRWVPKQNVHRISPTQAWIPRQKDTTLRNQQQTQQSVMKPEREMVKKTNSLSTSNTSNQKWIWQPKQTKDKAMTKSQNISSKSLQEEQQITQGNLSRISQQSIQQRALQLQIKLFGLTSVLLRKRSWLPFVRRNQGYRSISEGSKRTRTSRPTR